MRPWTLKEPANENSFIKLARHGDVKEDDLLEKVRVARLRAQIADAGLRIVREELHVTATVRRLPAPSPAVSGTAGRCRTCSSATWNTCWRTPVRGRSACRCLTSIAIARTTAARSRRSTAACSATTPPTPAGCAGTGSTAAIRTIPAASPRSGSRAKGRRSSVNTPRCRCASRVKGREVTGSWGMDVMVAPERQRRGLGEVLFRTWDRNVGASLGLGLSDASYRLFQKLSWPDVGPVPCLVKPLTRRAFRHPRWPVADQPADLRAHAGRSC